MSNLKTKVNDASVDDFLNAVEDEAKRKDCLRIKDMMTEITGEQGEMWGSGIVGFGSYHYTYASGREGDWFLAGFSPRKQNISLYIMSGFVGHDELMKKLGKYKTGTSCLYVKHLSDVDENVLEELIRTSVKQLRAGKQAR